MECKYGCGKEAKFQLKNGSWCCSKSSNQCESIRKKNSINSKNKYFSINANSIKLICRFCGKIISKCSIKKHEQNCYLNPQNLKKCPICEKPIKNFRTSETCSYSCSNTLFRSDKNNGNWKESSYRTTCFSFHKKECIICGENKIVAVHHYDGNHENNKKENLIPLCPTHHCYWHSKYRHLIKEKIDNFINNS